MLRLATEEGPIILESHSFRDNIRLLVARREQDYSSQGDWPDRIVDALFRKSRGGKPPNRTDQLFNKLKLSHFRVIRQALGRAARDLPDGPIRQDEILESFRERGVVLHPPHDGLPPERTPPGYLEQQEKNYNLDNLPRLARHLSRFKSERHLLGSDTLDDHAIQIVLEGWGAEARYGPNSASFTRDEHGRLIARGSVDPDVDPDKARKELERLKRNSNRRKKSRT